MQWLADLLLTASVIISRAVAESWLSILLLIAAGWLMRGRRAPAVTIRPLAMYLTVAAVALAAAAMHTIVAGEPHPPWYTDDFGNLLSADTFAHGRLSNPTHPMYRYFETLYILQMPRYMSMYPPAQPLLLAAAQVVFGLRVAALWIASTAAACAVAWAVAGMASPAIATAAGLLCAIHPTMMEWDGYYHAGAIAAAAGALAIGGALRIRSEGRTGAAIAMGIGMAILANSRPYEGLVISLIACALTLPKFKGLAIAGVVTLAGLAFTAYYDRSVTGDPFLIPYNAYNARYLSAPNFIWQKPYPLRTYPTFEMATRYTIFRHYYERSRNVPDFLIGSGRRVAEILATAIPSLRRPSWINTLRLYAALPLIFALGVNRRLVIAAVVFVAAILQITWWPQTHYLAPAVGLFAVLYAGGLQRMLDRGDGLIAWSCVAVAFALALAAWAEAFSEHAPREGRMEVTEKLDGRAGGQLVVAGPECFDMVFNAADIDHSKIVWAHSAPEGLQPLLDYYKDREVWRLSCGPPLQLTPLRPAIVRNSMPLEPDIFYPYHFPGR